MALERSESVKTTLSMLIAKSGKYQKWLGIINVLILLSSLWMIFFGAVLIWHYHMDSLGFITSYFVILPYLLIGLGVGAFVLAAAGFVCTSFEKRPPIIGYAVIMTFLSIALFGTVFVVLECRNFIKTNTLEVPIFQHYSASDDFKEMWNTLQENLRCCGGIRFNEYQSMYPSKCVPDSCCINRNECTRSFNIQNCNNDLQNLVGNVYTVGCLKVLHNMYRRDLGTGLLIVAVGVVITALAGIVGVALASAYSAQLNRRAKRYNISQSYREVGDRRSVPMNYIETEQFE